MYSALQLLPPAIMCIYTYTNNFMLLPDIITNSLAIIYKYLLYNVLIIKKPVLSVNLLTYPSSTNQKKAYAHHTLTDPSNFKAYTVQASSHLKYHILFDITTDFSYFYKASVTTPI